MSDFRPEEKNVVYVGEGVKFTGVIHAQDTVVIDGTIEGEITCNRLVVGPGGVAEGAITVVDADIFGKIGTEISVKQLLIVRSTGRVEGKWCYGEIEVEKGGVLSGDAESTGFRAPDQKNDKEGGQKITTLSRASISESAHENANAGRGPSIATRTLRERKKML
ncbi:MAG: polymer-forming cytoskeletal protein [Methylocystis sp.]|jgi:cytoskeletal protein CcmA (bactofilin family)